MDAIVASRRPVVVTHSNCRALVPAARCKTDEAIRAMASKGGVIGITMVRGFVSAGGQATIENVLNHIDHVVALAGVEHVGVGSDVDLDGRDVHSVRKYDLDGIDYAKKIYELAEGLVRRRYSNRNIELILRELPEGPCRGVGPCGRGSVIDEGRGIGTGRAYPSHSWSCDLPIPHGHQHAACRSACFGRNREGETALSVVELPVSPPRSKPGLRTPGGPDSARSATSQSFLFGLPKPP